MVELNSVVVIVFCSVSEQGGSVGSIPRRANTIFVTNMVM
jgi:hypothetical protein